MSPIYLANADVLRAAGVAPQSGSVRFEFQDLTGATFTLDVAAGGPGQALAITPYPDPSSGFTPLYQQHRDRNYWFTYIESSRTLYFAYNQCAEMPGFPFTEFSDLLWATFDGRPAERVIVDLRNNTGGDSSVLLPFLQSGIARFDQFQEKGAYVIIGRRSFSSALINAAQMHQGPVRLVGEPTGGSLNSYGEVQTLVLPNSRLNVGYSTRFVLIPEVPVGQLLPDVSVPIYSADYFARHDPFVAAALGDVAQVDATSSGNLTVVNTGGYRVGMPVAPGSLAAALGSWDGGSGDATSLPLPTMLAGAQVWVNDLPAPVAGVRPGQINFQVPSATALGAASVRIVQGGSTVASGTVAIAPAAPGLFVADTVDPSRPGVLVAQGGTIQLYGTGQGSTSPRVPDGSAALAPSDFPPRVFIGAELADVTFSGLQPSFPGVWQINVKIPAGLSGQVPIFVTMGGAASNGVTARLGN
jgi:uncharacterized protein (TIGR03437 family)